MRKIILISALLVAGIAFGQKSSVPPDSQLTEDRLFSEIGRLHEQVSLLIADKQKLVLTIQQLDAEVAKLEACKPAEKKP